mmetsp:Transcript_22212/g.46859  ORF Transcript_22212/g.46859 Transcript_22212/m.46859 type:complete len:209 (-) Transcript_22212:81-707(-)
MSVGKCVDAGGFVFQVREAGVGDAEALLERGQFGLVFVLDSAADGGGGGDGGGEAEGCHDGIGGGCWSGGCGSGSAAVWVVLCPARSTRLVGRIVSVAFGVGPSRSFPSRSSPLSSSSSSSAALILQKQQVLPSHFLPAIPFDEVLPKGWKGGTVLVLETGEIASAIGMIVPGLHFDVVTLHGGHELGGLFGILAAWRHGVFRIGCCR